MSGELEKRASDAEREQVVVRLRDASAEGRLTLEELADRTRACGLAVSPSVGPSSYRPAAARVDRMEGGGFGFPFGGDPEEIMRGLREFAEQQAESVQEAQREQFATLTLNTAVELTAAALQQIQPQGGVDEQAIALRDAMRVLFPEAVALVSAARQGFMRET